MPPDDQDLGAVLIEPDRASPNAVIVRSKPGDVRVSIGSTDFLPRGIDELYPVPRPDRAHIAGSGNLSAGSSRLQHAILVSCTAECMENEPSIMKLMVIDGP